MTEQEFQDTMITYATVTDTLMETLEIRIAALEEVAAATGPMRLLAVWRLSRDLRASIRPWPGMSFRWRRAEAVNNAWLTRT